ncbi:hypothetical protein BO86DRAFT_145662 [Aspergillus japonicus CBS 114.51]|uniref:Uncharacterized protein n=1 Tax=Aspergillus japonicus CBS 114.51 TaxID=1448312 RepID=A0A8T8WVI2_ASPJA|nr:hypothetical protein BO86DRAFT_145662 [Aspergillus japonicus CBS 114.51]RAH79867.1 hypothetical protein BO86DRAFT_145662 [Aspergillus japonicus CBS 114.51]
MPRARNMKKSSIACSLTLRIIRPSSDRLIKHKSLCAWLYLCRIIMDIRQTFLLVLVTMQSVSASASSVMIQRK